MKIKPRPIEACFRILAHVGQPGQYVWQNGKLIKDPEERLDYLRLAIDWFRLKQQDGPDYWRTLPVDFQTFVEHEELMNKRHVLWPGVMVEAARMNDGSYSEAVLTGAIGVAKTTIALYSQAYQQYLLSCMRDMHKVFDLDPSSEITTVFQSINKSLSKDVDYKRFRDMIDKSPYFKVHFPYDHSVESEIRFPRNVIVKPVSGGDTAAIGQNVIGGILDEVNFMAMIEDSKHNRDGTVYDQAKQNYNSIARRRESRFMQLGALPGMLCLVSSRNYPGQFTDIKEAEARTNPRIFIYDKCIWDIRPERFNGETFPVFIGDATRKPRLLTPTERKAIHPSDERLVRMIPTEYHKTFAADLLAALRDVAGVATQAMHPFMLNQDAVANSFGKVQSIASRVDCNFKQTRIMVFKERFKNVDDSKFDRFAHVDLSFAKDSCGVAIGYVEKFVEVERGPEREILPVINFDMTLEIQPPPGEEIIFENIRAMFYKLRQMGLPLRWVTFDQFQSKDSMQILAQHKFHVGNQSMDKDTFAYDVTKQAFYDGRVKCPEHERALTELIRLELDVKKQKIDHPPNGSKDVADAMAGVIYGLTMRREVWSKHSIPLTRIPAYLTVKKDPAPLQESRERGRTPFAEMPRVQQYTV